MVMPVAPAYGGGGFGGFGGGGDWAWILLLLLAFGGGFGGGFGGFDGLYPWMNNSQNINDGFRDQMLNTSITSIGDKLNNAQLSSMQSIFGVQSALQNCCCENRASVADLKYTVATENCADRATISDGIRDILAATQAQTQTILDKMCAQEIENLKAQNIALQNQVNMQNLAASQTAQTAAIVADNTAQTQYLVNRIAPYPVAAYVVANPTVPATI
jgi:hypothetical protein